MLIHRLARVSYPHRDLDDGDEIVVGPARITVMHTPGHSFDSINPPVSYGQFGLMVSWLVGPDVPLLLIANDDEDLTEAVDALMVVGMSNPLLALDGSPDDWRAAGLPLAMTTTIDVEELDRLRAAGETGTLIDVREASESASGTIPEARVLPYRLLREGEPAPPLAEPVIVVCNSGNRSALAVSLLQRRGLRAINVAGGTTAWAGSGRALAAPA